MKKLLFALGMFSLFTLLPGGCTHLETGAAVKLKKSEQWVILPLQNLAETPRAGQRVESILQSLLKNRGVHRLTAAPPEDRQNLALLLDDGKRLEAAKIWAIQKKIRYGISGSIQEWQYKTGLDGEPTVGITLNLIDLENDGALLWTATASRTGWGSENLTTTTAKVLNSIIAKMEL